MFLVPYFSIINSSSPNRCNYTEMCSVWIFFKILPDIKSIPYYYNYIKKNNFIFIQSDDKENHDSQESIAIEVKDTGSGIHHEIISHFVWKVF